MANKKNNINELVTDEDDPTSELDASTIRRRMIGVSLDEEAESDAATFDFDDLDEEVRDSVSVADLKSDLKARSDTIERLQYDIAQLHSKWLGLEAEIKSREEQTERLSSELKSAERKLQRKEQLLDKRDSSIKTLKKDISDLEIKYRDMQALAEEYQVAKNILEAGDEINHARAQIKRYEGVIAGQIETCNDLQRQQERTERYADELRRQLGDLSTDADEAISARAKLRDSLREAEKRIDTLQSDLDEARQAASSSAAALEEATRNHADEIKTLRFELGEAESTLTQQEQATAELASELVDTKGSKSELERMLGVSEERNSTRIEELESEVASLQQQLATTDERLQTSSADFEEKLQAKNDVINGLLAELSRKSQEVESMGEIEDVILELDDRISQRIDERPPADTEKVTRLLVGSVDDKELRFPLFKDRLTIGRTDNNDIQLKAQYISRRHAVLLTEGDATRLIDWGSKNGVYVNSGKVSEQVLKHGDIVTIGTAKFRYEERPKRKA